MNRIAVLIAVYNAQQDLERTMRSIDAQDAPFEFFIVDDGSQPPIAVSQSDYRHVVNLIRLRKNGGCVAARNAGLAKICEGRFEYIAIQDAGDTDLPGRLEEQCAFMNAHPEIAVVGAWAQYVDRSGNHLYVHKAPAHTEEIRHRMRFVSAFPHPACMFRVSMLKQVGMYDADFPIASDYELLFRITEKFPSANLQKVLVFKEDNPKSYSIGKRRTSLFYRLKTQMKFFSTTSINAYLGILSTLFLLMLPYRVIVGIKRWRTFAN